MTPEQMQQRIAQDSADGNLSAGHCPFCGGEIIFPRSIPNNEGGYVMHDEPPCETYRRLKPMDFMMAACAKLTKSEDRS